MGDGNFHVVNMIGGDNWDVKIIKKKSWQIMEKDVETIVERESMSAEREISDKIKEFLHKGAWYQITIRGVKGLIKEVVVTETKHFE